LNSPDAGEVINLQDKRGQTPLMKAVISGNEDIIIDLIGGGAEVNIQDGQGFSSIHYYFTRGVMGVKVLQELLKTTETFENFVKSLPITREFSEKDQQILLDRYQTDPNFLQDPRELEQLIKMTSILFWSIVEGELSQPLHDLTSLECQNY